MKYRPFGNTGMTVSEIGFGANTISGKGSHGYVDESQGAAAVQRAYEVGVTFFDTAEGYSQGRSEEVIGRVLGNKDDVVVCTKVGMGGGPITADRIRSAAEASLSRLHRDAIDVYLLHNPSTELLRDPAVKEVLEVLQRDGLIRTYGVAILAGDQLGQGEAVVREQGYSSMEITLNVAEQEAGNGLLAHAGQSGLGVIIRAPMGGGLLTGKYDRTSTFGPGDNRSQDRCPPRCPGPDRAAIRPLGRAASPGGRGGHIRGPRCPRLGPGPGGRLHRHPRGQGPGTGRRQRRCQWRHPLPPVS